MPLAPLAGCRWTAQRDRGFPLMLGLFAKPGQQRGHVVGEAARVVEELTDRDFAVVRDEPRKMLAERIVETEAILGGELQNNAGDERLRDAPDREPVRQGRLEEHASDLQ